MRFLECLVTATTVILSDLRIPSSRERELRCLTSQGLASDARATRCSRSFAASSVVVAFPIFLFLSRGIYRELARNPIKRLSAVRRWLTYLTLFVTAGFLIGDLTTLVYNALGGELTIRFVLKVLIVGAIAGTIFGFYLWDLRGEEREA